MDGRGRVLMCGGPPILAFTSKGIQNLLKELEEQLISYFATFKKSTEQGHRVGDSNKILKERDF
jgi:hypothetical protein